MDGLIPYVGSILYYLPVVRGKVSLVGQPDEIVRAAKAELLTAKGDFDVSARLYETEPKDSQLFPSVALCALTGAIGRRDDLMFDTILSELRDYPKRTSCSHAKLAVELTEVLLRQRLMIRTGSPAWLDDLDLSGIPAPWRSTACYLSVKMHYAKGEYAAAEVAAKILLQLVEGTPSGTFGDVGLKLACGAICQETDRNDGAARWYRHAVESALSSGIVIPFLGLDIGPKSGLGLALKGVSPALFGKVKALSRSYFGNLIHFHNRYSGEKLTDALTPREFYFAEALKRGLGYKAIAARMGISAGRANIMVRSIYQKLHIHSRKGLSTYV